jgi:hypothetical protein
VLKQAPPHVTRRDPDNRIFARVIGRGSPEEFHSYHAFLQGVEMASDRLPNDELKELNAPVTSLKYFSFNHFLQMKLQGRNIRFSF